MREADENTRRFIEKEIQDLTMELSKIEKLPWNLEGGRQNRLYAVRNIEKTKERLLPFKKYAETAQQKVLKTLIQSIVEPICITDENGKHFCHIFMKRLPERRL